MIDALEVVEHQKPEAAKKAARPHGTGSIWQPKGSTIWHIQYFRNGKRYRESAHTDNKTRAKMLLKKRQAEITTGNFAGPRIEKITVSELVEELLRKYRTGEIWRKGEVLNLKVNQVDLLSRTIRLKAGETKNDEGRTVKMTDEVVVLLTACVQGKQADDFVFTRDDGKPVRDFRKTWRNVTERAGVPDLLFHDLRRTGARNLRRLGVAEGTAMKIGGWKTRTVFDRYNIIDESDLADAAERLNEKRRERISQQTQQTAPKQPQSAVSAHVAKENVFN